MISDQDRKLAEETFDLIEQSTASGNSFEASQPAVTPEPQTPLMHMLTSTGNAESSSPVGPVDRTQGCTCGKNPHNFRLSHHDSCALMIAHADVSMALAEHTAPALDALATPDCPRCHAISWGQTPLGDIECTRCRYVIPGTAPALDMIEQAGCTAREHCR